MSANYTERSEKSISPSLKMAAGFVLLALAVLSGVSAFQMSAARQFPELAASLWPNNGWADLRAANVRLVAAARQIEGDAPIPTEFDPAFTRYSRAALAAEPLAVDALRNIGLDAAGSGDTARARSAMLQAEKMSRRDPVLNLWLSQDYALAGKSPEAFRQYDILLRTNTRSLAATLPILAQSLANDAAVDALFPLLAADPPWHQGFWAAVIQNKTVAANAGKLRTRLHEAQALTTSSHDGLILRQLIDEGEMETAFDLYEAASRTGASQPGEMLRDAGFDFAPLLPPFEWEGLEALNFGSSINHGASVLEIVAEGDAQGVVAQQIVALQPGRYRFAIEPANPSGQFDEFGFAARVTCAELQGAKTFSALKPLDENSAATLTISGACRHYWVALVMEKVPSRGGDARIDMISLKRMNSE